VSREAEGGRSGAGRPGAGMDSSVPQSARVYDYWLGGKDNYPADRALGEALAQQIPTIRTMVRAQRAFLRRAVRYLVRDAGVRQFLDVGTGIPTAGNVHEVAQEIAPNCRVLYVDNDPLVLAHARALMTSTPTGSTAFITADLRTPDTILDDPALASTLDLDRPVALMLIGILHHLHDADDPYGLVRRLLEAMPSGSYFVLTQPTADFNPEAMAGMASTAEQGGIPYVPRSYEETSAFLEGLEPVEPGVVPILAWRPELEEDAPGGPVVALHPELDVRSVYGWAAVARKP